MKVFLVSQGQDVGGQNARTVAAFRRHAPDWDVRAMHVARTYIKYPYDLGWDPVLAHKLYDEADVVHHQNRLYGYAMYDGDQRKPAVVTHHGPPLRSNADEMNREASSIGAVQTVSTVDLLADAPHAEWTPNFYDLQDLVRRYPRKRGKRLRIGHAPTVREAKGTDTILAVLRRLQKRYPIDIDLVEGASWNASLAHKSRCDIYVDQLTLGYGLSAIESMTLGVPVVSGWEEEQDRDLFLKTTGEAETPFMHVAAATLEERLIELIRSPQLRDEYAERGRMFVQKFHDEERGVEQWKRIYRSAKQTKGVAAMVLYSDVPKEQVVRKWAA